MGISRFFRWLSERYPLISQGITTEQIPCFDNLYFDLNGIVHHCSHGNSGGGLFDDEDQLWVDIFQYISFLVSVIKPKKLLYLAVDGVAPRAKMNQQRSRRFRAAFDREEQRQKQEMMASMRRHSPNHDCPFDSNCITPGTRFMHRLTKALQYFVHLELNTNPIWKNLEVILSGPDVPGEGEHKIMDFIRKSKSQPEYDPNTRHCLYGLDADLIMLGLTSHEVNFCLLREEIIFHTEVIGGRTQAKDYGKSQKFQLLHLGLLRDYLELDFCVAAADDAARTMAPAPVLKSGMTRGEIRTLRRSALSSALPPDASKVWNLERFIDDFVFFCFLSGNDFLPHLPLTEIGEGGLATLISVYRQYFLQATSSGLKSDCSDGPWLTRPCGTINFPNFVNFLRRWGEHEYDELCESLADEAWMGGKREQGPSDRGDLLVNQHHLGALAPPPAKEGYSESDFSSEVTNDCLACAEDVPEELSDLSRPKSPEDLVALYYLRKVHFDIRTEEGQQKLNDLLQNYLEGLQWNLYYYRRGVPSWSWFYRCHYHPYVLSLLQFEPLINGTLAIDFDLGEPFSAYQQLMGVLPPASATLLPKAFQSLMGSSPLDEYYPSKFEVDTEGAKAPWDAITLLPFIDQRVLSAVVGPREKGKDLTSEEKERNRVGRTRIYIRKDEPVGIVKSPFPKVFRDIPVSYVLCRPFAHPNLPKGLNHFKAFPLPGWKPDEPGYLSLHDFQVEKAWFAKGISLFNSREGRHPGVHILYSPPISATSHLSFEEVKDTVNNLLSAPTVTIGFPTQHLAKPVCCWIGNRRFRLVRQRLSDPKPGDQPEESRGNNGATGSGRHVEKHRRGHRRRSSDSNSLAGGPLRLQCVEMPKDLETPSCDFDWRHSFLKKGVEFSGVADEGSSEVVRYYLNEMLDDAKRQPNKASDWLKGVELADIYLEVIPLDERLDTTDELLDYRLGFSTTLYPLVLTLSNPYPCRTTGRQYCSSQLIPGTLVMCIDTESPWLGCLGKITEVGSSQNEGRARLLCRNEPLGGRYVLQAKIRAEVIKSQRDLGWFEIDKVAQLLRKPTSVLSWLTRSILVTGEHRQRYDIGLNMTSTRTEDGNPLCLPNYAKVVEKKDESSNGHTVFSYSSLAIDELVNYINAWPSVVNAVQQFKKQSEGKGERLTPQILFPGSPDPNWELSDLSKWLKAQRFGSLRLCCTLSESIAAPGIDRVSALVDDYLGRYNSMQERLVEGLCGLYPIELTGALPETVLAASSELLRASGEMRYCGNVQLGQRVVVGKWSGCVPFGSLGTVLGILHEQTEQMLEVLLDEPSIACDDLGGRCAPRRGLVVPASAVIPIPPIVVSWGCEPSSLEGYNDLTHAAVKKSRVVTGENPAPLSFLISCPKKVPKTGIHSRPNVAPASGYPPPSMFSRPLGSDVHGLYQSRRPTLPYRILASSDTTHSVAGRYRPAMFPMGRPRPAYSQRQTVGRPHVYAPASSVESPCRAPFSSVQSSVTTTARVAISNQQAGAGKDVEKSTQDLLELLYSGPQAIQYSTVRSRVTQEMRPLAEARRTDRSSGHMADRFGGASKHPEFPCTDSTSRPSFSFDQFCRHVAMGPSRPPPVATGFQRPASQTGIGGFGGQYGHAAPRCVDMLPRAAAVTWNHPSNHPSNHPKEWGQPDPHRRTAR